jgi:hypothetical protein
MLHGECGSNRRGIGVERNTTDHPLAANQVKAAQKRSGVGSF